MKSRIVLILFFATVAFLHAKPISDPDLFWHLATGRWILEHGQLPDFDPFNYTTAVTAYEGPSMARVVSRQYWLADLFQYGVVSVAGYAGLLCLRIFFALSTVLVVFLSVRKRGLSVVASLLLVAPLGFLLASYAGDRPNQLTYFFLAAFLYLIDNLDARPYLLPLLMLFWANVHGGFIFGAAVAGTYLFSEFLRTLCVAGHRCNRRLVAVLAVTILTGFLNPNGYNVVSALIRESTPFQKSVITELMRPTDFIAFGTYRYLVEAVSYVSVAGIAVLVCAIAGHRQHGRALGISRSQLDVRHGTAKAGPLFASLSNQTEHVLLVTLFGFLSFTAVRFIPLLAIASTPVIGNMLVIIADPLARRLSRSSIPEMGLASLLVCGVWSAYPLTVLNRPLVSDYFPEPAVGFIKRNGLQGRLFNYYDWGGFLLWRFYPDKVVFVDGRGHSERAYLQYLSVIGADRSIVAGVPVHKAVLDASSVRSILIPGTGRDGGLVPLIALLENDPEWRLVFYFKNCLLYTRETSLKALPKIAAYAIAMESAYASLGDDPRPYLTVARTNIGFGRWREAAAFLEGVLEDKPALRGGPVESALGLIRNGRDILREDTGLP